MNTLIILGAKYLILVSIIAFLYQFYILDTNKRRKMLWFGILILPISYILAKLGSYFYFDPRPFVTLGIAPLIPHVADNGFPSDHMLLASSLAGVVYLLNKKRGILLFFVALLIGFARVFALVRHIKDILGSLLIVIFVSFVVQFVMNKRGSETYNV
ncbi:hypothetical protein BH11PAT3_BH11PAT3_3330 [soil metagenome]